MATIRTISGREGIIVTVNAQPVTGQNMIAAHRPTRYALMMRRQRANVARKARGEPALSSVLPGDCSGCAGLGVIGYARQRCHTCNGSGER